jgi:flagellar hook assembly protein FlgD
MVPGIKPGRVDSATIPPGRTVNFEGGGKAGAKYMELSSLTVNGTLRGVSSGVPINIKTTGNITVGATGHIGGSVASTSKNNINLDAGGTVTVNGTVEGQRGSVSVKAAGNITVGNGGAIHSQQKWVNVVSSNGSVNVNAGGQVSAQGNVGIQSGPGQPTNIDGKVKSNKKNIYINGKQKNPGNVTIGKDGSLEAPNGEVKIKADTLRISGTIKAKTIQKYAKVTILDSTGTIDGKIKTKNKIDTLHVAEEKSDPSQPTEKGDDCRITGDEFSTIDLSFTPLAIEALVFARVSTGFGGTIDFTGNFPGTPVISCPGPIEIFADNIILEPGVSLTDICGPGPVTSGIAQPIFDVVTLCVRDTTAYPGWPGEVEFLVANAGNLPEMYLIEVVDSLGWTFDVSDVTVFLPNSGSPMPHDSVVTIGFDAPPWAIPDADTNKFTLTATCTSNPAELYSEHVYVEVADESELKDVNVTLWGVDNASPGDTARVENWIMNNGQLYDDYDIIVTDREGWELIPPGTAIGLPPNDELIYLTELVVPSDAEFLDENELYITVQSLSSPSVVMHDTATVIVGDLVGVGDAAPDYTEIEHYCYPNPFNPFVNIHFTVPAPGGQTTVEIYDVSGRKVRTIFSRVVKEGIFNKAWDGLDEAGKPAASGIYFYRISVGDKNVSGKMILVR